MTGVGGVRVGGGGGREGEGGSSSCGVEGGMGEEEDKAAYVRERNRLRMARWRKRMRELDPERLKKKRAKGRHGKEDEEEEEEDVVVIGVEEKGMKTTDRKKSVQKTELAEEMSSSVGKTSVKTIIERKIALKEDGFGIGSGPELFLRALQQEREEERKEREALLLQILTTYNELKREWVDFRVQMEKLLQNSNQIHRPTQHHHPQNTQSFYDPPPQGSNHDS